MLVATDGTERLACVSVVISKHQISTFLDVLRNLMQVTSLNRHLTVIFEVVGLVELVLHHLVVKRPQLVALCV